MTKKWTKILFIILTLCISCFTFPVRAKQIHIDSIIGVEKKFENPPPTCKSILGDVNNEKSTAWLVQTLLNYLKILGPTIAIVLGSLDFGKAVITSDEESMKKAKNAFIKRIIAAVALFFVPLFVQILLGLFGITTDNATCGLK